MGQPDLLHDSPGWILSPPETAEEELLSALLGPDASLDALKHVLIARTEGNPFFLEESVRIARRDGGSRRGAREPMGGGSGSIHATQVPVTVQAVLAARIDRLSPEDKRFVHPTSSSARTCRSSCSTPSGRRPRTRSGIGWPSFKPPSSSMRRVSSLTSYTFKHALTHEVAYGSVLSDRRRGLGALWIVEAIERIYSDRLVEHVDRLAHHAFEGHVWSKAVNSCRQAGVRAYERSAYAEAAAAFQRAIDALAHLPETPESARLGIDIRLELRHPATLLRQFDKVSEGLREAERLARLLSDARRLGWVLSFLAEHYRLVHELGDALSAAEHAMKIATTVADHDLRVVANMYLGQVCWTSGDYQAAARHLRVNVEALQGDLSCRLLGLAGPPSIISRSWLARSLGEAWASSQRRSR